MTAKEALRITVPVTPCFPYTVNYCLVLPMEQAVDAVPSNSLVSRLFHHHRFGLARQGERESQEGKSFREHENVCLHK